MSPLLSFLLPFAGAVFVTFLALAILRRIESGAPARALTRAGGETNLRIWAPNLLAKQSAAALMPAATTLLINALGFGQIALPAHGWWLLASFLIYALAMDLAEYVFHRAQHAIPALWALHSLHHSDRTYDATTTLRHHWLDPLLKSITVWLAVALAFKTPPAIVFGYSIFSLYNFVTHSNLKFSLGRCAWLLNTPHYHRRHHGEDARYHNSNYAALFPIFDVVTGAYVPPEPNDYPDTGLNSRGDPQGWAEILAWPLAPKTGELAPLPRGEHR